MSPDLETFRQKRGGLVRMGAAVLIVWLRKQQQ